MSKRKVAVLGATGAVGQRFVQLLHNHPWFEVTALTGSDRTIGQTYGEGCRWILPGDMPDWARRMRVSETEPGLDAEIVFSAISADLARDIEPAFAAAGHHVFSNASAYRMAADVPLLIPEVNADHAALLTTQRRVRNWSGSIATNCNCTATGFTVSLKPLQAAFGLRRIFAVSMQAASGAGYPGVPAMDLTDNVIPYISGEEEKMERETCKMLGALQPGHIEPALLPISAHTNRVPVLDGHTVCVTVEFDTPATPAEITAVLQAFKPPAIVASLPSSPARTIEVRSEPSRPQPRLDREAGGGMTTVIGRVRTDSVLHARYVVLSHNTIKGAAGGSLQNAELCQAMGLI